MTKIAVRRATPRLSVYMDGVGMGTHNS